MASLVRYKFCLISVFQTTIGVVVEKCDQLEVVGVEGIPVCPKVMFKSGQGHRIHHSPSGSVSSLVDAISN